MAYLTKADFTSHIYTEVIDEITRTNDTIVDDAVKAAIDECKSYLSRFDLLAIFGDDATAPTFGNGHLKNLVKDVACWHIIKLANPNINMELFRTLYSDAIKFLEKVMMGKADPGYPYKADNPDTEANENNFVQWGSNPKRTQHF